MGLLSNRIDKESLKPGDHIYSWRTAYIYAHHGIYIGDDKVIHFTGHGPAVGTGTFIDRLTVSSVPSVPQVPCTICTPPEEDRRVVISCLNCFLSGGILNRFEYAVSAALFLAKVRGGTCTLAVSDPPEAVVDRAKYLLENGLGCYNMFKNNCEDFAIYCKTGLLVLDQGAIGQGGQVASIIGGTLSAALAIRSRLKPPTSLFFSVATSVYGMAASAAVTYCANRYAADIGSGMRRDVVKVSPEDLRRWLSSSGD